LIRIIKASDQFRHNPSRRFPKVAQRGGGLVTDHAVLVIEKRGKADDQVRIGLADTGCGRSSLLDNAFVGACQRLDDHWQRSFGARADTSDRSEGGVSQLGSASLRDLNQIRKRRNGLFAEL
jgi:hypothetical protein